MAAAAKVKLSSFYGAAVPRPYVLLDKDGEPVQDRVDAPQVNDALIEWASKVPFEQGGALVKPHWDGAELPREPRSDFQIFFQERADDIWAANPAISASDRKAMLSAASVFWQEQLTPEQRAAYRERAAAEKTAAAEQIAEAEAANPKFKAFREKLQAYKRSVSGMLSAAKVSAGPLWRVQRRLNAKYRALDEAGAGQEGEPGQRRSAWGKKGKKAGRKGRGRGASAAEPLVGSDDSASDEDDDAAYEAAAAADAAAAIEKLLLATAKKGGKAPRAKKGAGARAAPAADQEEDEEAGQGEEGGSPPAWLPARGGKQAGSGTAALARRVGSKGRKEMYANEYELPPSQDPTPAKARAGKKGGKAAALADEVGGSPGKRTRATRRSSLTAAPLADESPAKRLRRSARK